MSNNEVMFVAELIISVPEIALIFLSNISPTNHSEFANVLLGTGYEYIKSFVWITRISFLIDANLQQTHTCL